MSKFDWENVTRVTLHDSHENVYDISSYLSWEHKTIPFEQLIFIANNEYVENAFERLSKAILKKFPEVFERANISALDKAIIEDYFSTHKKQP